MNQNFKIVLLCSGGNFKNQVLEKSHVRNVFSKRVIDSNYSLP